MYLDKRRTFRLTGQAIIEGEKDLRGLPADATGFRQAACVRIFLLADDPGLSIDDVDRILTDYIRGDILGFRRRRLIRLRTRLGSILYDYKEKHHV
jgi:hypothetical protein